MNTPAQWLVIAGIVVADAVGLPLAGLRLGASGVAMLAAMVAALLGLALVYRRFRPRPRLGDFAHRAAQLLTLLAAAAVLSYCAARTALPLQDGIFAAADRALGFDWRAWFGFVAAHPGLRGVLHLAYASVTLQLVVIPAYLALSGQPRRGGEFIAMLLLSVLPTIAVSALLPGAGAFVYDHVAAHPPFVAEFAALRQGEVAVIDLPRMQGVITFPSFHTTLALLFVRALRGNPVFFALGALLNAVVLLSVPSEGGHYLVDLLAGAAVAGLAIAATARSQRPLAPESQPRVTARQPMSRR